MSALFHRFCMKIDPTHLHNPGNQQPLLVKAEDLLEPTRARAGVKKQTLYATSTDPFVIAPAVKRRLPVFAAPAKNALFPSLQRDDDATLAVVRPPRERTRKPRKPSRARRSSRARREKRKTKRKRKKTETKTRLVPTPRKPDASPRCPRARARRPARRVRRRRRLADASSGGAAAKNKRYL